MARTLPVDDIAQAIVDHIEANFTTTTLATCQHDDHWNRPGYAARINTRVPAVIVQFDTMVGAPNQQNPCNYSAVYQFQVWYVDKYHDDAESRPEMHAALREIAELYIQGDYEFPGYSPTDQLVKQAFTNGMGLVDDPELQQRNLTAGSVTIQVDADAVGAA